MQWLQHLLFTVGELLASHRSKLTLQLTVSAFFLTTLEHFLLTILACLLTVGASVLRVGRGKSAPNQGRKNTVNGNGNDLSFVSDKSIQTDFSQASTLLLQMNGSCCWANRMQTPSEENTHTHMASTHLMQLKHL